jgi:hypothetical protein
MESVLHPIIDELLASGVQLAGFVADNEAVNGAAFKQLQPSFPFLVRIPCAAHTLQLVVKKLMELGEWKELRDDVQHIFAAFFSSPGAKERRQKLATLQLASRATALELMKPNTTRWNSELYACERLSQLADFVQLVEPQRDGMWLELKKYVAFLKPFQVATDVIQSDSATLFDVQQQWGILRAHVSTQPESGKALKQLRKRWLEQIHGPAAHATAMVSMRKPLAELGMTKEQQMQAQKFIVSFGVIQLSRFSTESKEVSVVELKGRLLLQLADFSSRTGRFSEIEEELTAIQAADAKWNPITLWKLHQCELSEVARVLLSLPASEAAVERTFSAQGLVHTKLRNRMLNETVQKEMFVAFNDSVLSNKTRVKRPDVVPVDFAPDVDSEADVEEDSEESKSDSESESEDEMVSEEPVAAAPAAAAAVAAPVRSRSLIVASNESFLDEFIRDHPDCLSWRWNDEKVQGLEAAAAEYSKKHGIATQGVENLKAGLKKRRQPA